MVFRRHKPKPSKERSISLERIEKLFSEAESAFKEHPELSKRYVELARKIAMKFKVRMRSELKRRFCKNCHSYLKQGVNCRVRLNKERLVYYCLSCKKYMRLPYRKKNKKEGGP